MKPALIIFINSLRSGGAERVVSQLLEHLQQDFDIHLALYSHIIEYKIPAGIKILDLHQDEKDSQLSMLLKLPGLSYKVNKYCLKHGIRHSVAFLNRPCYINALMRVLWGYKGRIVMCERTHETNMLSTKSFLTRAMTKFLISASYNKADLVLANAQAIKDDLKQNLSVRTPVEVIYNPVDTLELRARAAEPVSYNFEEGVFHFAAVGNFRKEKNFPLLIDAFAHLKGMNCKLLLVGDGPDAAVMKQKVAEYGIVDQVVFLGRDSNPFKYLSRADAFVLCSDVEGFPNVLLEALACGRAVISTDCRSGPREMLAPDSDPQLELTRSFEEALYGILTPVGNPALMGQAMKKILSDKELRKRLEDKATLRAADFDIATIRGYFRDAFAG